MFSFIDQSLSVLAMAGGGAAGGGGNPGSLVSMLPLVLIGLIFFFLVIRPNMKKTKAHRELVNSLGVGDEVITDSGILGTIQKVSDDFINLEIAPKVSVRLARARVAEVLKKGKPSKKA